MSSAAVAAEPEPPAAPAQPRFMSQDEDLPNERAFFFSSPTTTPPVATTVTVATPARPEPEPFPESMAVGAVMAEERYIEPEMQPQQRDYADDFEPASGSAVLHESEMAPGAVTSLFGESSAVAERDLDVPAFLRRLKF
jgi:hypothetical protein